MREISKEELGFVEWVREREHVSPILRSSLSVPMDIPVSNDVRLEYSQYSKMKNDFEMLYGFAAVVLRCPRKEVTAEKLMNFMGYFTSSRSASADKIAIKLSSVEYRLKEAERYLSQCTCEAGKEYLSETLGED